MRSKHHRIKRKTDVVTQEVDKDLLIYDMRTHMAYCLNETSALVYQLCDGDLSPSDIADKLTSQLKRPVSEDLVWLAIDQLQHEDLVERDRELETRFAGLSRRDAIRHIAGASLIALPIVSAVLAPPAAHAQSAGACGGPAAVCQCAGAANVSSCVPAPGVCQVGCSCKIADPVNDCAPDGFGGVTCNGNCG
jgi:hypothetical protein